MGYQLNDPQQLVMDVGLSISQLLNLLHSKNMVTLDLDLIRL